MDAVSEVNLYSAYEKRIQDAARQRPVLPITIITGFLGAGKTTLLKKILRSKHNLRIAAVVNDYGSVDHDGEVVERDGQTDSVDKLAGGCVCCHGSLGHQLEEKIGDLLRKPDYAEDRYDYLVIETSGVSDPETIIRALDKTFGKLTRARLDSVVVVVDGDFLFHEMKKGEMAVSFQRQLAQADVILLNKADLLDEKQLAELSSSVSSVNSSARIISCSYGQVPLHEVLDVEAPRADIQGVSHERIATHLHVSVAGGNLRKASSSCPSASMSNASNNGSTRLVNGNGKEAVGHLEKDGLEQLTFTSKTPLSLARFQDWVSCGMPAGAIRAKGILAFDEDRLTRSVFNMSGRRRVSFAQDGVWEGPLQLHLVVIGVGIDRRQVLTALEGMCVPALGRGQRIETELSRVSELLERDMLFDPVRSDAEPACPAHVVRFRFTGRGAYGIPPSQLSVKFGVRINAVNHAILRAVNSGAGVKSVTEKPDTGTTVQATSSGTIPRVFLTCQQGVRVGGGADEEDCLVLRYALAGNVSLPEAWPYIVEQTRGVMSRELGHVHFCNCFS